MKIIDSGPLKEKERTCVAEMRKYELARYGRKCLGAIEPRNKEIKVKTWGTRTGQSSWCGPRDAYNQNISGLVDKMEGEKTMSEVGVDILIILLGSRAGRNCGSSSGGGCGGK